MEPVAASSLRHAEEMEYISRLCVRPCPKWMPKRLHGRLLEWLLVWHHFEPCLRCKCGEEMK